MEPETRTPLEAYADLRQLTESPWDRSRYEAPRGVLENFDPERAALPATSLDDAARYLKQHRDDRPWLRAAEVASPEAGRVIAAADAGGGHAHIRHEGWVTEAASMLRAARLEDPAQLDAHKKTAGIDAFKPGSRRHVCADMSTRITDPEAFATAFARGVQHKAVRAALDMPYEQGRKPDPVPVPIADLLGANGHKHCTGWRLEAIDGSMENARRNRAAWAADRAHGAPSGGPEPAVRPVRTFEGGEIVFVMGPRKAGGGYEIITMFPRPVRETPS